MYIFFQLASGADLGILFINVLKESGTDPLLIHFEKITNLFCLMRPSCLERDAFLHDALRWSVKGTNYKTGHPDLHQKIAKVFWRGNTQHNSYRETHSLLQISSITLLTEKNYLLARQHFIHSRDGSGCANMLLELHQTRGYSNEGDLFVAQAVLQ